MTSTKPLQRRLLEKLLLIWWWYRWLMLSYLNTGLPSPPNTSEHISVDFVVLVEIFRRRDVINLLLLFWFPCFCYHPYPSNTSICALQPMFCSALLRCIAVRCSAMHCTYTVQYSALRCTYPTFTYLTSFMCSIQRCVTVGHHAMVSMPGGRGMPTMTMPWSRS